MILEPVIIDVKNSTKELKGKVLPQTLSKLARIALQSCAKKHKITLPSPLPQEKDNGAPLSFDGNYWSISHKTDFVMAAISNNSFGVDVEKIYPRSPELLNYVLNEYEQSLIPDTEEKWYYFYRFWTGKESILKAKSIGMAGLSKCRVKNIINSELLEIIYEDKLFHVKQIHRNNHIFAISCEKNSVINWNFEKIG